MRILRCLYYASTSIKGRVSVIVRIRARSRFFRIPPGCAYPRLKTTTLDLLEYAHTCKGSLGMASPSPEGSVAGKDFLGLCGDADFEITFHADVTASITCNWVTAKLK
jgi:hypothetical protein